jgi:cytochrome c oxidase subunit 4
MSTDTSHISSVRTLLTVFVGLMAFTALTTAVAYVDLGAGSTAVALSIAIAKASLVVWFFMNVRFNTRLIPVVILGGLFFVLVLFVETFADYGSRGWFGNGR